MANEKNNIVLCGFMGSGKTTVGELLAQRLDMRFVDMDEWIEAEAGMTVADIFAVHGEAYFREREHDAAVRLGEENGLVVATGGGALTFSRNVEPLRKNGVIIYLNPGFEECWQRIETSDRPLVKAGGRETLARLYIKRDELYRKAADHELSLSGTPEQWTSRLASLKLDTDALSCIVPN